jgi:hypothetical protein
LNRFNTEPALLGVGDAIEKLRQATEAKMEAEVFMVERRYRV